jgi:hypothetical protein
MNYEPTMSSIVTQVGALLGFSTPVPRRAVEEKEHDLPFVLLRLRFTLLSVTYPKSNDVYHIHVYPSHTVSQAKFEAAHVVRPLFLEMKVGGSVDDVLMDLATAGADTASRLWLEYYVYSNADDDDGLFAETRHGAASLSLAKMKMNQTTEVKLRDMEKAVQAVLQVTWVPRGATDDVAKRMVWQWPISPAPASKALDIDNRLVDALPAIYDSMKYDKDTQSFYTFNTYIGVLPIICFPILATAKHTPSNNLPLLLHLLRLSCASLQLEMRDVASSQLEDNDMGELLCEMLSWIPRCILYVADFDRGKRRKLFNDVWWRPGSAPRLGVVGGDCEDLTELVLELVCQIQQLSSPAEANSNSNPSVESRALATVREFAQNYTPFMSLGTLLEGDTYLPHAHPVLLDRRYVRDLITPSASSSSSKVDYFRTLTVEPTNYLSGVWDEAVFDSMEDKKDSMPEFSRGELFFARQHENEDLFRRLLRSRIPSLAFQQNKVYGTCTVLLTASYYPPDTNPSTNPTARSALHLVLYHTSLDGMVMGVPTEDVLLYRCTSANVKLHAQLEYKYIQHILNVTRDLPPSYLPTVHTISTEQSRVQANNIRTHRRDKETRMSIRQQDYRGARKVMIDQSIRAFNAMTKVLSLPIQVTDTCCLTELFI